MAQRPKTALDKQRKRNRDNKMLREAKGHKQAQMSPLEYLLHVINDPNADTKRKDRLALVAMQYVHEKKLSKVAHTHAGRPPLAEKPIKLGKKEQLVTTAKTAHKNSSWNKDLEH